MKRSRPPRPRVKLNRDAVWELLDRLGMSWNEPGRRSCPDNGFAQLQEWTDGGSVLASPCGRTGPGAETAHPTQQKDRRLPRRLPGAAGAIQGGVVG